MQINHAAIFQWAHHHQLFLFPIPHGRKAPDGIVASHRDDCSADPAQWATWSQQNPDCNFGVECGPSNVIVVDVDKPVNENWAGMMEWFGQRGVQEEPSFVIQTPTGGFHCYFKVAPGLKLRQPDLLKKRVNVRAGNGYVVAPWSGTLISCGDGDVKADGWYSLIRGETLPTAPSVLVEHCSKAAGDGHQHVQGDLRPDGYPVDLIERQRAQQTVDLALRALEMEGAERNAALNEKSFELHKLWLQGKLSEELIKDVLLDASYRNGYVGDHDDGEQRALNTIASGKEGAQREAQMDAGVTGVRGVGDMFGPPIGPTIKPPIPDDDFPFWDNGMADMPLPEWTVDEILPKAAVSLMVAQHSAGKTAASLDLALSVATGRLFCGQHVNEVGGVVVIAAEAPANVNFTFNGYRDHVYPEALAGTDGGIAPLFSEGATRPAPGQIPFTIIAPKLGIMGMDGKANQEAATRMQKSLEKARRRFRENHGVEMALIIVDTLAQFATWENENNSAQIIEIMRSLDSMAKYFNCAVLATDHMGRTGTHARGSSAKEDGAFAVLRINDDRDEDGVIDKRRLLVTKSKGSMGAGKGGDFIIRPVTVATDKRGNDVTVGVVKWDSRWGRSVRAMKAQATKVPATTQTQPPAPYVVPKQTQH